MKYIIDGSFLYGHIKGVQRYARQITKELDKYMADKPYEVEIAVPEIDSEGTSAEINSYKTHYNNIKIVILAGKSGRMWEQFTFQRYVDKQKAKPVYLCNEVSLFMKNGIVLNMKYSADDEMKKNDYVFNDLIKNKFYFEESLVFSLFCLIIKIRS